MIARSLLILAITLAADAPGPPRGPASAGPSANRYDIRWNQAVPPARSSVDVVGIDPANLAALARSGWDAAHWSKLFSVYVEPIGAGLGNKPAASTPPVPALFVTPPSIVGSYRVVGDVVRFEPRFELQPGLKHWAGFSPGLLPMPIKGESFGIGWAYTPSLPPSRPTTSVVTVYPTSEVVPENLLKLYLHFSAPMSRGEVYDRVRVLDASGRALDRPFLEIGEELWDPSGTRLTLLFDPGRIKRGLKPREELGPILEAGKTYTLVIDRAWPDAAGNPLRETFRRTLRAGPPDETQPDPKTWTIDPPASGTRERLTLTFPEPLDHAMLGHALTVRGIEGQSTIDPGETRWRFRPVRPWPAGPITLVVDTALEDLAGNSIARPFEVDVQRPIGQRVEAEFTTIHTRTR